MKKRIYRFANKEYIRKHIAKKKNHGTKKKRRYYKKQAETCVNKTQRHENKLQGRRSTNIISNTDTMKKQAKTLRTIRKRHEDKLQGRIIWKRHCKEELKKKHTLKDNNEDK